MLLNSVHITKGKENVYDYQYLNQIDPNNCLSSIETDAIATIVNDYKSYPEI